MGCGEDSHLQPRAPLIVFRRLETEQVWKRYPFGKLALYFELPQPSKTANK